VEGKGIMDQTAELRTRFEKEPFYSLEELEDVFQNVYSKVGTLTNSITIYSFSCCILTVQMMNFHVCSMVSPMPIAVSGEAEWEK